jgi:hypothetical protein
MHFVAIQDLEIDSLMFCTSCGGCHTRHLYNAFTQPGIVLPFIVSSNMLRHLSIVLYCMLFYVSLILRHNIHHMYMNQYSLLLIE